MGKGSAAVSRALNCISEAPFDPDKWPEAMKFLGDATGSSFAQIAGWISPGRLPLSIHWNEPDGMIKRWVELGGADPDIAAAELHVHRRRALPGQQDVDPIALDPQ